MDTGAEKRSPSCCLGLWLAISLVAMLAASALTRPGLQGWYAALSKPPWTPPPWLFGPVWVCLYAMMGVAADLVWRKRHATATRLPLLLFSAQLLFNVAWAAIFFALRMPGAAFIDIAFLWCLILATLIMFWRRVPASGVLMLPYLAWVAFASVLNFAIWRMNL